MDTNDGPAVGSNDELGLLPEPYTRQWINCPFTERLLFTEDQMRAYAAQAVAAERERLHKVLRRITHFTSATPNLSESGCGRLLAQIEREATKALEA